MELPLVLPIGKGKAIEAVKVILVEKGGSSACSSSKVFIGDLDAVAVSGSAVSGRVLAIFWSKGYD